MPNKNKLQKKKQIILGFVGKICSGKGVAVSYLAKKHDADIVMFSQSLRDSLQRLYIPQTRENLQKLSKLLRDEFGQDIFSQIVLNDVLASKKSIILIDGIRRKSDYSLLKTLPHFSLIGLESSEKIRFERLKKRKQNAGDASVSWKKFLTQDTAETEKDIDAIVATASIVLQNNGSLSDFKKKLDALL
jgi:dephospho-CoA kinase